jgi:hypothetical protein
LKGFFQSLEVKLLHVRWIHNIYKLYVRTHHHMLLLLSFNRLIAFFFPPFLLKVLNRRILVEFHSYVVARQPSEPCSHKMCAFIVDAFFLIC